MRKYLTFLITILLTFSLFNCSSPAMKTDVNNANQNFTYYSNKDFDEDSIMELNNSVDSKISSEWVRNGKGNGILGSFSNYRSSGAYMSSDFSYERYTYSFYNNGRYVLFYEYGQGNGHGSDGISTIQEQGVFVIKRDGERFYISLTSTSGIKTDKRYVVSQSYLLFLPVSNKTNYETNPEKLVYQLNCSNTDIPKKMIQRTSSNKDGLIGIWMFDYGCKKSYTYTYDGRYALETATAYYYPYSTELIFSDSNEIAINRIKRTYDKKVNEEKTQILIGTFSLDRDPDSNKTILTILLNDNSEYTFDCYTSENYLCLLDENKAFQLLKGNEYIIRINNAYGTQNSTIKKFHGDLLSESELPVLSCTDSLYFCGWYCEDEKINCETEINKNMTITAKWVNYVDSNNVKIGDLFLETNKFIHYQDYNPDNNIVPIAYVFKEKKSDSYGLMAAKEVGRYKWAIEPAASIDMNKMSKDIESGYDAWEYICSVDTNYSNNAIKYYPAFNYANTFNHGENWYIPSIREFEIMGAQLETLKVCNENPNLKSLYLYKTTGYYLTCCQSNLYGSYKGFVYYYDLRDKRANDCGKESCIEKTVSISDKGTLLIKRF